jgi:hypothetical protein
MLDEVGFRHVKGVAIRRNPRNDYTDWASFEASA